LEQISGRYSIQPVLYHWPGCLCEKCLKKEVMKITRNKKKRESAAVKQTDSQRLTEVKSRSDSKENFNEKQRMTAWPSHWNIKPLMFDYSKNMCRIFIGKLQYEDRRMIVFSNPTGDVGIVLTAQEIRSLKDGIGLHFLTEQPVKIEKGSKISVPEPPK